MRNREIVKYKNFKNTKIQEFKNAKQKYKENILENNKCKQKILFILYNLIYKFIYRFENNDYCFWILKCRVYFLYIYMLHFRLLYFLILIFLILHFQLFDFFIFFRIFSFLYFCIFPSEFPFQIYLKSKRSLYIYFHSL